MKILVHDFVGHSFTVQLARSLANIHNEVTYISFANFQTPKGKVENVVSDVDSFVARQIKIEGQFDKDNLLKRWQSQRQYASKIKAIVEESDFDIVLSTAPIEVQEEILRACKKRNSRFIFWVQDIHAEAIERVLKNKNRLLGKAMGIFYRRREASLLRKSESVIVISDAFKEVFSQTKWGLKDVHMDVIQNWCNMDEIPRLSRENSWSKKEMFRDKPRIIYSGTLARKHNPDILIKLAQSTKADVYLFSEGSSAKYVEQAAAELRLENLFVRPWVSIESFPQMLAAADIALAVIEEDAGVFSVPSKVLNYMAAGKPILASIPHQNLAAQNIRAAQCGLISAPGDFKTLIKHAEQLLDDADLRREMGDAGRRFADINFNIDEISTKFHKIFRRILERYPS